MERRSRRILHLIDTAGPGGAETIFLNLVNGFGPPAWQSFAVLPQKDWLWYAFEERGVTPVLLSTRGSFDVGYLRGIARLARLHGADLIQAHLLSSSVYGSLAAMSSGLPVVCTFHGRNDVATASYRGAKFSILRRRANRYVFVSQSLRDWFVERERIDRRRAHVIHNGIDCNQFKAAREPELRAEFGAGPNEILVGAVGNLRAPKDYPTFVRTAALLAQRSPRYRFVIVGAADEPIRTELLVLMRELKLGDRMMLAGFRPDVERVMNALDVYVLSSVSEGFSLTTVQAMACETPVVATRCGGPEEIVVDGHTGLLVPPRDPNALAAAIDELSSNEPKRAAMREAGRARAERNFSIASMIASYGQLYAECLGSSRALECQSSS